MNQRMTRFYTLLTCLLAAVGRLPQRRRLGALVGRIALPLMRRRRRVAEKNLLAAFPAMTAEERRQLLRRHFAALGESFMDTLWALSADERQIGAAVRVEGAFSAPCLLLVPHFLGLELALLRLSMLSSAPLLYYYKPMHNSFWNALLDHLRRRRGADGLSTSSPTALLSGVRRLRRGAVLCYLPDIDPKLRKSTIFAPFLGMPRAATTSALSRIAAAAKVDVVPMLIRRTADGYALRLLPPLADFPSKDGVEADVRRINNLIGDWVLAQPENYFWLHRRFKTTEGGGATIYD